MTIAALLLFAVVTAGLVPLIQRDLRRAHRRRVALELWADIGRRVRAGLVAQRDVLPAEEFARVHLNWWTES